MLYKPVDIADIFRSAVYLTIGILAYQFLSARRSVVWQYVKDRLRIKSVKVPGFEFEIVAGPLALPSGMVGLEPVSAALHTAIFNKLVASGSPSDMTQETFQQEIDSLDVTGVMHVLQALSNGSIDQAIQALGLRATNLRRSVATRLPILEPLLTDPTASFGAHLNTPTRDYVFQVVPLYPNSDPLLPISYAISSLAALRLLAPTSDKWCLVLIPFMITPDPDILLGFDKHLKELFAPSIESGNALVLTRIWTAEEMRPLIIKGLEAWKVARTFAAAQA